MERQLIDKLERCLRAPLPGADAQYKMAHAVRRSDAPPPADARQAGVLALFFPKDRQWHLVLIERQSFFAEDRHRGQISFPGGGYEEADRQLVNTALRETEEEVGVDAGKVEILGALTQLYIPVSNFLVNPFVGFVAHTPAFRPDVQEVKTVLEVPFELFRNPATVSQTDIKISEHLILRDVPYFDIFGKIVWGATAMMLSELLTVLEGGRRQPSL